MVAAIAASSPKSTLPIQTPVSLREPNSSFLGGSQLKALSLQLKPSRNRTGLDGRLAVVASAGTTGGGGGGGGGGRFYLNFTGFPFPLGPFLNRRTIRTEVS